MMIKNAYFNEHLTDLKFCNSFITMTYDLCNNCPITFTSNMQLIKNFSHKNLSRFIHSFIAKAPISSVFLLHPKAQAHTERREIISVPICVCNKRVV